MLDVQEARPSPTDVVLGFGFRSYALPSRMRRDYKGILGIPIRKCVGTLLEDSHLLVD